MTDNILRSPKNPSSSAQARSPFRNSVQEMFDYQDYQDVAKVGSPFGPRSQSPTATSDATSPRKNTNEGYEQSRIEVAALHEALQKKTFTRWINSHLNKVNQRVNNIYEDLASGEKLALVLTLLTDEPIKLREKGHMKFHQVNNLNVVLDFIKSKKIKLVGIGAEDIIDGKKNLILGLIWTIILHFQISLIVSQSDKDPKKEILEWVKKAVESKYDLNIHDLTTSWTDGIAFAALIHRHRPDLIDINKLDKNTPIDNLHYAFQVAQDELDVMSLLEAEDLAKGVFDEKCTMTYLCMLKQALPPLPEGNSWSEKDQLQQRYDEVSRWVEEKRILLSRKEQPTNLENCKREINIVNRTTKDCKSKENEVISIQKFEEKIRMMTGSDRSVSVCLDIESLLEQIHLIEEMSQDRSAELSKLMGILEHIEEIAHKAKLKLAKISAELKALNAEIKSLQTEYSTTSDSKKIEKLNKRKEAASIKAEANRIALNETDIILQSLPAIECKAISDVQQSYTIECENLSIIFKSLAELQPDLPDIDSLIEWIRLNTEQINNAAFSNDMTEVRQDISSHTKLQEEIDQFSQQVVMCQRVAAALQGTSVESFSAKLQTLETGYAHLCVLSKKRAEDLRVLEDVLHSARDVHDRIEVLEVREKIRRWNPLPNPQTLENELKVLDKSIKELTPQITKLHTSCSALIQHPAYQTVIQPELHTVEKRRVWINSLQIALETHVRDYAVYREYNVKLAEFESELTKADNILLQYESEIDSYSVDCITVLNQLLKRCEQEMTVSLNELEDLAVRTSPYHLRNDPDCKKLLGYLIVKPYEINGLEAGNEVTITSMEMNENWEVELSDGEPTMITSAIIQMCPENDFSAPRRITELRERHRHLREVLTQKLGLVESVGELIQQVEASAEAVNSWDKSSLIGSSKQAKTDAYMDFVSHSEDLLAKLPGDTVIKEKLRDKITQARSHWTALQDEAAFEELKDRLVDLEGWCRYWQQNLNEQAPLGITMERVLEQMRWEEHLQTQFPEKFQELIQIMDHVKSHTDLQPLADSVTTQLNQLQDNCNSWQAALSTLKGGFDQLGTAWEWLLQLEEQLLKLSDKAMTADTQGQENLELLRQSVLEFINTTVPQHEPSLKSTLAALADISEQLETAGGSPALKMGAQALRHRWDLMLTEATRLDQGLGGLTKLVALLPRLADELGQWIDEEDLEIANRDRCLLEIVSLTKLINIDDRFHKGILLKTPDFEEYSKSAQIHDQIILTITQSHQSYARTLSNARPNLCYNTEADPNATHRFQEDADKLLGQWDDLLSLSEKSLEYKQGTLAALEDVMKLYNPINEFLEEAEYILYEKPKAFELETWLTSAEEFMRKKSSYEPAAATFIEECESLISTSDASLVDTVPLEELLEEFKQRWNSLQLSMSDKQQDCRDQIEKLRDEKTQIEAICKDLQSHITSVSEMRIILRGISLPAANQSILDKQKTTLEKSETELKEEERRSGELLHKIGDVSANINSELDQSEMASQVEELETSLQELQLAFRASQTQILEQDAVVQPFEPQLNMLLALQQETKEEFQARPTPALDSDLIKQEIEFNMALKEKLSSNAQVLEETLETGKNILSKANQEQLQELSKSDFHLDPQIADSYEDLKQKLNSLEVEWSELNEAIQQSEQSLSESAQLAAEGCEEVSQILKRIQTLMSSLSSKGPPGAVPVIVEEQLTDMQHHLAVVSEIDTSIETLKDKLQINASSPGGLAEQLARLEHEQSNLRDASNEYNGRLQEGLVLATKYSESHKDLMCWLQDKMEVMSKWEPLGLDTQLLDIQLESLTSFRDILSSRVDERQKQETVSAVCSGDLRPSHETTTQQYAELCELWDKLESRIQERTTSLEKMHALSQSFEDSLKVTSAKLDEISSEVSVFKPTVSTEIEAIKSEITEITVIGDKLDKMTSEDLVQLSAVIEQMTSLAANGEFTDQTQTVTGEKESLDKDSTVLQVFITDRLTHLQSALDISTQIKAEQDDVTGWIKTAAKSLDSEFVIRGVSGACTEELAKVNAFHETLEEMQTRVGRLEQLNIELSKLAAETDKVKLDKSIVSLRAKVGAVVHKEENVTANLQDALMEAQSFESMCSDMDSYIVQTKTKLDQLTTEFNSGNNKALQELLESVKELLLDVSSKQTDMDKISEKGAVLEKKSPQDGDAISTNVANLLVKYEDLQTHVETLQSDMDQAFIRAGELRTATQNLINWLKETDLALDNCPPLVASVECVEQALAKHRAMGTQLATKTPTIKSILEQLPSMNMAEQGEELRKLVEKVQGKLATRGDRIIRGLTDLRQFQAREMQLRENLQSFLDQLDYSENCYGVVTVVEEISIQHEALMSHLPEMEQVLDEMKEIALSIRTGNFVDDLTLVEDQLKDISLLWEEFSTRAQQQNTDIYDAAKTAQKLANLYTQLLNWLEPTFTELLKNPELTPNSWDNINKRVTEMEASLEQHREQYEEFMQIFLQIEPRAHETGLEELNEVKSCISQFWTQVESSIQRKRKELEAASKGIEDLLNKLVEIAEWTDSSTEKMETIIEEPIPSSVDDLEKIELMIGEHETFMDELAYWHKELEPVNRTVKAIQKTEKGKEMEELRKKVNKKMQKLWVHASERQRGLKEAKDRIIDTQIYASFDYRSWLENLKSHMAKQKMREGDMFRKADLINYTYLSKEEFITQLKNTGFSCLPQHFELVANLFEEDKRHVNVDKFMKSFRPRIENDPRPDKEVIDEHVKIEVNKCCCDHKFRVDKKETTNGLMYQFGDNKTWRLVRILRNSVMVRVGGGWEKLDIFLQKHDPCRSDKDMKHLHHRMNTEIYDFNKGPVSMMQMGAEYHTNRDLKTQALKESHKHVSVSFHDPTAENTPIKSMTEISHIKESSPQVAKKSPSTPVSPNPKKKLETGATPNTPPLLSKMQTPTSRALTRPTPLSAQGATGTTDSSKTKPLSRNSSFKDNRPSSASNRPGSASNRPVQAKTKAKDSK